ncbi:MAG: hypothetical protein LV477_06635 [Candidatus Nitrosotalea sp.]|nr:hypothetical protein [Candidatus Nitrosotalea sp.]
MKKSHFLAMTVLVIGISIIFLVQIKPNISLASETPGITTIVRTNSSHTAGYYGLAQVTCNNNEALTGGGYYSAGWHQMLSVYRNEPSEDGKKWLVDMMYVAPHYYGAAPSFTIYAICAKFEQ